jgi:hypothetical protein
MRIFQNSSNKVTGLRVRMPATADNTAYTLRTIPLPLGTFAYRRTSYILLPLYKISDEIT